MIEFALVHRPRIKPRILELRAVIRAFVKIFVDGFHANASLNNDSNSPSTCRVDSPILPRRPSMSRQARQPPAPPRPQIVQSHPADWRVPPSRTYPRGHLL